MSLRFEQADADRMTFLENKISKTIAPYRENTEAALAIFALVRCARVLLQLYPLHVQVALIDTLHAFLRGETKQPGAEPSVHQDAQIHVPGGMLQ